MYHSRALKLYLSLAKTESETGRAGIDEAAKEFEDEAQRGKG